MLAEIERGRRNRRTIDAVLLVSAAIVAGLTAVVARSAAEHDADVAQALVAVLGWADSLWRVAFVGLLGLALVVVLDVLRAGGGAWPATCSSGCSSSPG